jgi:hypothetical protein
MALGRCTVSDYITMSELKLPSEHPRKWTWSPTSRASTNFSWSKSPSMGPLTAVEKSFRYLMSLARRLGSFRRADSYRLGAAVLERISSL